MKECCQCSQTIRPGLLPEQRRTGSLQDEIDKHRLSGCRANTTVRILAVEPLSSGRQWWNDCHESGSEGKKFREDDV